MIYKIKKTEAVMEDFKKEVQGLSSHDILLILNDQADLYTQEEIEILKQELAGRSESVSELENARLKLEKEINIMEMEAKRAEEKERLEQEERERQVQLQKIEFERKIANLKSRGYDGYYEYKTISLVDENGGSIMGYEITQELNEYALEGWRLVAAYSNELGHNSTSGGIGGFSSGTNSTIDQNILIMERFVKI